MCHQDKGHAQSQREEPQNLADKFVNTIKGLYPFGIHGCRFDARQFGNVFIDGLHLIRRSGRVGRNDKDVGQRVAIEHGNEVLVEIGLQFFQTFLLADKADFIDTAVALEQVFHRIGIRTCRIGVHINRNLRRLVEFAQHALSALDAQIHKQRQGHGNGKHEQGQQRADGLAQKLFERGARRFDV